MAFGRYATAGLGIGAIYLAFPANPSDTMVKFAQPAETATQRLAAKRRVVEGTGLGSLTVASDGTERGALLIRVARAGTSGSATCRVTVRPLSPAESSGEIDCAQSKAADRTVRRLGADAMGIIVREHVAAAVEDRPYDIDRVADRMIGLVTMNGPALAASMRPPREGSAGDLRGAQ